MRQTHLTIYHAKNKQIQSNKLLQSFIFPKAQLVFRTCVTNAQDGRVPMNLERSSAQQAYIIERDNDFAPDDELRQVVQVAQRLVFQNPSPEIHRRGQFPVDSFQLHKNGSAIHLASPVIFEAASVNSVRGG
jgi:hypothetical protein